MPWQPPASRGAAVWSTCLKVAAAKKLKTWEALPTTVEARNLWDGLSRSPDPLRRVLVRAVASSVEHMHLRLPGQPCLHHPAGMDVDVIQGHGDRWSIRVGIQRAVQQAQDRGAVGPAGYLDPLFPTCQIHGPEESCAGSARGSSPAGTAPACSRWPASRGAGRDDTDPWRVHSARTTAAVHIVSRPSAFIPPDHGWPRGEGDARG